MCGAIFFSCDFLICVHVWCGFLFMCFFDMCSCVVPYSFHVIFGNVFMCGAIFFSCDFLMCSCVVRFSFHMIFGYVFMCGAVFFSCDFLICVHVWCHFLFM